MIGDALVGRFRRTSPLLIPVDVVVSSQVTESTWLPRSRARWQRCAARSVRPLSDVALTHMVARRDHSVSSQVYQKRSPEMGTFLGKSSSCTVMDW